MNQPPNPIKDAIFAKTKLTSDWLRIFLPKGKLKSKHQTIGVDDKGKAYRFTKNDIYYLWQNGTIFYI